MLTHSLEGDAPPPKENFVSDILRSLQVQSWGEIARVGQLAAKPRDVLEARI